jgi:hypothetical protein
MNKVKLFSFVFFIIAVILFSSCRKNDKNIIRVEGMVYDPNTNEYVQNASVILSASKLNSGGIFSSGYEDIATMTTDGSGTFACEFKEDKFAGFRFTISKIIISALLRICLPLTLLPGVPFRQLIQYIRNVLFGWKFVILFLKIRTTIFLMGLPAVR